MRILMFLLLSFGVVAADEIFNSNLLVESRINPDIINTVVSNTRQNVAYRMEVNQTKLQDNTLSKLHYYVVVDPFPSYGTELQIQVPQNELQNIDEGDIKKSLDEYMSVQLYVQHSRLYDVKSFKRISHNENETIIRFSFMKKEIPVELKHLREMYGYLYIVNGKLEKIVVKNSKRFDLRGVEVDRFVKTTFYRRVQTGGYLVSKETLLVEGLYNNLPYQYSTFGSVSEYWNAKRQRITFENGQLQELVNIDKQNYKTIAVDLDRTFPLLGKEARKAGYDLPKPFGVTLVNMFQDTTMHMTSFKLDGIPVDFNKIIDGDSTYKSLTYAPLVRADLWVLPFVSFSLILGATDTSTDVTLVSDSGLSLPPIFPANPPTVIIPAGSSLALESLTTNALLYGVGATVAGGFNNYFTTIDFQYIVAYTPSADVSIDMMIITPLVGYTFDEYNTRLFIGAQYQRLAQSLTFDVIVPNSTQRLSGEIGLRSEEWAGVIGTDYTFTRNWSANLLYSQGIDRRNAVLGIAYRF